MIFIKLERSNIKYPLWRKKVDYNLLINRSTPIPNFAADMWNIEDQFLAVVSKKDDKSKVNINFDNERYLGWVTSQQKGRKSTLYRLSFNEDLALKLRQVFTMTYFRGMEGKIRTDNGEKVDIELEIPFWEFLDLEYDFHTNTFFFSAYYSQKPLFPGVFKKIIDKL